MSVFKRKESRFWWYSIYKVGGGYVVGSTGKEIREEAEAVEKVIRLAHQGKTSADRLHAMIDALSGCRREGLPLASLWDTYWQWMQSVGNGLSEDSLRKRRRACERFAEWASENWPAAKFAGAVDRACVSGFASWLAAQGTMGKTRRNIIADLGAVWGGLQRVRDDVQLNPWPLVLPKDDSGRLDAFTPSEVKNVLDAADKAGHGWGLACRISLYTGLRYGDVARLLWECVDLDRGFINLNPRKTARHGIIVTAPICAALATAIGAVRRDGVFVLPEHAAAYPKPEQGTPGAFSVILTAAGVSGRHTFHSWRHTFRTRLSQAGVTDEIAKRLGGWTEDATAMKYDHDGRSKELTAAVEAASKIGAIGPVNEAIKV